MKVTTQKKRLKSNEIDRKRNENQKISEKKSI